MKELLLTYMNAKCRKLRAGGLCAVALGIEFSFGLSAMTENLELGVPAETPQAVPWEQIGVRAGAGYRGDGLGVIPAAEGARLRCSFQRLEGEATPEGLWLNSTVTKPLNDRFHIIATALGRGSLKPLPKRGSVSVDGQRVRFTRHSIVEEYSVSMDGVRQDFVVQERPAGTGELAVLLAVRGAKAELLPDGVRLVLGNSGRKIAYTRLRVSDAKGRELTARIDVLLPRDETTSPKFLGDEGNHAEEVSLLASAPTSTAPTLAMFVNDADAVYPVRIDPTFSDDNWISMGGVPGADSGITAAVVDGSGNLYVGGCFNVVGDVVAHRVAKWDGTNWSALGSGVTYVTFGTDYSSVSALAVSGSDLYVGGSFTNAGGVAANSIAKWDGSHWSAIGSGLDRNVSALAVSGSDLYVGGDFATAGGVAAKGIARWNGSNWSALGSGADGSSGGSDPVSALAVSGSDLYVGGRFTVGDVAATNIARWDGSNWSALGSGIDSTVNALAVSGSDLYAGGVFTKAGQVTANYIAKRNGTNWSALGSGIGRTDSDLPSVSALAVSGSNLYAGGWFTTAGGVAANNIAKWDGANWSALGSGLNGNVFALAASGTDLYAGGWFTTAGGVPASNIAKWDGNSWSALGSGVERTLDAGAVYALAVSGSDLYAGGDFRTPGNHVVKWNGSSCSALGSGIGTPLSEVFALAVSGSDLYVGGWFTTAGGVSAQNIAKWNGSSWSALGSGIDSWSIPGSGMNLRVNSLAVSGTRLYAGGPFMVAGGKVSGCVAHARIGSIAGPLVAANSTVSIEFSGVTGYQYDVQRATSLKPPITWATITTSPLSCAPDGSFAFTDTNAPAGAAYYRSVEH